MANSDSSPPPHPSESRQTLTSKFSAFLAEISSILCSSRHFNKYHRRKSGFPLPLPSSLIADNSPLFVNVLDGIFGQVLKSMHEIQKSLQFWQSRAEGTDVQKIYFMVLERGPRAFVGETIHMVARCVKEGSPVQYFCNSASNTISKNISALTSLQYFLATFLSQVYIEVDKHNEMLINNPNKAFPTLLMKIDSLFLMLETSINNQKEFYINYSCALMFEKLHVSINHDGSQEDMPSVKFFADHIQQNLTRLDSYTSVILSRCQKPSRLTLHWLRYTCSAVGISACTFWLLRHSRVMGSSDLDDWFREAKESITGFWKSHVEQPLISIRDELFETFRRRHKGVIEVEEVKLTEDSLHRMLLTFIEQTKDQKIPKNASDQEMLEIVMARYEVELMHPIRNLFSGELARGMLIQIQKLKLDLETAMLELDQILKANEINFAILAALPAFFLSVSVLMLGRSWVARDKGAEGRGRLARLQRRLLLAEIERKIMEIQSFENDNLEKAEGLHGLVLYNLDLLYKAVEKHAMETGEWISLKHDLVNLGRLGNPSMRLQSEYQLVLTSHRMERYECMLPSLKRH
ncbi:hypothetical protein ZOSMA_16G00050 [Zostera marina]|uniref:Nuclear control of ATPase protein n=1 Tax=Zostera marina TaxID=29655 RepID=A0A0K9PST5_ZOSMR|nr:hypothetical protein ZOSMA_16G00050 [Zostera marina]